MAKGWSVSGKRVEIKAGWPAGKLVIDGNPVAKLPASGDTPVEIAGRNYVFRRKRGLLAPVDELLSPGGQPVPLCAAHTLSKPAPAGSLCALHAGAPAQIICARCGNFACAACSETDGTHCPACIAPMIETHKRRQADLVLMAPAFIFMVSGGLLGGLLGGGAGALSVALARKIDSKTLKWVVALAVYFIAAILFVVVVGMVRHATGKR